VPPPTPTVEADDPFKAAGYQPPPNVTPPVRQDGSSPHSDQPWYQDLGAKVSKALNTPVTGQALHEASHAFTMGFDDIVGPLPQAIARTIQSGDASTFTKHYTDVHNDWAQARQDWEQANPEAAAVMSGLGMAGSMILPFGAAARGASLAARLGRGVTTSVGVGTAGGFGMTEGDLEQRAKGAVLGGVAGAALAPVAEAIPGAIRWGASVFRPTSRVRPLAGQALSDLAGAGGIVPRPAPVPGVPLSTAEATGSTRLASATQQREALGHVQPQRIARELAQSERLRTAVPGHVPGVQADVITATSTRAEQAIRRAQEISGREERRLWNTPHMTRPNVSTNSTKAYVNDLGHTIRTNEPGLMTDALSDGRIQSVIRAANALPDHAAANQINGIASQFGRIARDHTAPGEVRAVAGRLQRAAQDGLWAAPEIAGAPSQIIPRGWRTDPSGQMVWHNGGVTPAIRPNPQLVRDMREARAFTQREAQTLGHANFDAIFSRNSYGNQTLTPGSGLNRFFNFSTGRMAQGNVRDVDAFLSDIGRQWARLGDPAFNAADTALVRDELAQNTRQWLTASLLSKVAGAAEDSTGNKMLQMGKLRDAIRSNRNMLERSGTYTPAQMDMWDRVADTAAMIHNAVYRGKPIGSPTFTRLMSEHRFVDLLFGGPIRRLVTTEAFSGALGWAGAHLMGGETLTGIGLADIAGIGLNVLMEHLYAGRRTQVLELLDEAFNNPAIAQDLMQSARRAAQWSDATRRWTAKIMAITGPRVGAAYAPQPETEGAQ